MPLPAFPDSCSGKSGAFFWISEDARVVGKSISKEEAQTLLDMLPAYLKYLQVGFLCGGRQSVDAY